MTMVQKIGAWTFALSVLWGIGAHHAFPVFERAGSFQFH